MSYLDITAPSCAELAEVVVVHELGSALISDNVCVFVKTTAILEYVKFRGALCIGITETVDSAIPSATECGTHQ
jgi:hypothetical protein